MSYDAGILNDFGGGDVQWWHDYVRSLLDLSDAHYQDEIDRFENENSELQDENEKMKECLKVLQRIFKEKVENNESYLVEMKKVCLNEEFYDKAQTNIMDTKAKLVLYRWFYKKATEALKG